MEARITLPDEVTEHGSQAEVAENMHPGVVQDMIGAGIVTHQIDNAQTLDAVFAVSQIRDLPEVRFVAAFDNGLILLGCPDGPPESLAELVKPVVADTRTPEPELAAKLDALATRVEEMHKSSEDRIGAGLNRMETLSHRLEFVADALHPDNMAPSAEPQDLDADFAALRTLLEGVHDKIGNQWQEDFGAHIERFESSLSAVSERNANQSDAIQTTLTQLAASLNTLIDKVDDVSSKKPDTTNHVEDAVAPLAESMGTLQAALSRLEANFQQIAAMGQQESPEMSKLTHAMADLHGKIQDLANSDAADRLDGLTGEVAGLKTMLTDSIPHVSRSVEAMQSRVTALTEIAQRLDDMDPKRGFDRIEAGLGTISQNADATLRGVQDVCAWVQNGEMGDQITSLTGKIDAVLDRPAAETPVDDLIARFNDVANSLDALPERMTTDAVAQISTVFDTAVGGLHQDMKRLAHQPKPVIDLTEQRRGFANFTAVMSALTQKLEATAEQIAKHSVETDQTADIKIVLERMEALPAQLSKALPPPADMSAIETRIDTLHQLADAAGAKAAALREHLVELGQTAKTEFAAIKETQGVVLEHVTKEAVAAVDLTPVVEHLEHLKAQAASVPDAVAALRTEVAGFAQKPAAPLDLTAQRESFARFGTAMGAVVGRLEGAIAHLDARAERADAETSDLQAVVHALPVALHQALEDAQNTDVLQDAIAGVRRDLAQVAEALTGVEELRSLIEMLARRPDPTPDMSEQRRGFARFGTAMATVVQRLEHVSSQLDDSEPVALDFGPITAELDSIRSGLDAISDVQNQQAATVQSQLADLLAGLTDRPTDNDPEPEVAQGPVGHVSIEEMRFLFAELVACQMRDNADRAKNRVEF